MFECDKCEFKSSGKLRIMMHRNSVHDVHDGKKSFACKECNYKATLKDTLRIHQQSAHEENKAYPCGICEYRAAKKNCEFDISEIK